MKSTDFQLKGRVKELKCLYDLSRLAHDEENDLKSILSRTIKILTPALQVPQFAEAKITLQNDVYMSKRFSESEYTIAVPMNLGKKLKGSVEVGYRKMKNGSKGNPFLTEEKRLLKTVAGELSVLIK